MAEHAAPLLVDRSQGAAFVRVHVSGRPSRSFRMLVDTGSAVTWLPSSRLRLTGGSGRGATCVPVGTNFSQRYADGSRIRGIHCMAELRLGGLRFRQRIGAATETEGANIGAARHGVLALSPSAESSFHPLLAQLPPARQLLSLCVATGWLLLGQACAGPPRTPPTPPPPLLQLASPRASHWKLAAPGAPRLVLDGRTGRTGRTGRRGRRGRTHARPLRLAGALMRGLEVQLDSGTTHLALPATLHDQLLPAATRPASLALTLRDGRITAVHNHTPARSPLAPPSGALHRHAPASTPAVALLLPLSHGCRTKEGASSAASGAASGAAACLTCLRSTAAPVLATSTQLILGLPFLLHYDVSFYRRGGVGDTLAVSVSRSSSSSSTQGGERVEEW